MFKVLIAALAALTVIAGSDYFLQRFQFMKRNRMSKQEIKEEFRQYRRRPDGQGQDSPDPTERARRRMMAAVPKATVVITNPTHFAVALKYESGKMAAPICVAKGTDALALRIREVAKEHDVPMVENPPLARAPIRLRRSRRVDPGPNITRPWPRSSATSCGLPARSSPIRAFLPPQSGGRKKPLRRKLSAKTPPMMATRSIMSSNLGIPAGGWRWAALGFVLVALTAAGVAIAAPDTVKWTGVALLFGIMAVGSLFLYVVWPRESMSAADARRVAEAAARANVAWAITGPDGAVLDCNDVYRRMAGAVDGEAAAPPELALAGEPSAAVLYRLTRGAAEGVAREESFTVAPGLEIVAAVRPLTSGQTTWWFTPRLSPGAARAAAKPADTSFNLGVGDVFRDAPMGVAFADADGKLVDANVAFKTFFGSSGALSGRTLADLVEPSDRESVVDAAGQCRQGRGGKSARWNCAPPAKAIAWQNCSPVR